MHWAPSSRTHFAIFVCNSRRPLLFSSLTVWTTQCINTYTQSWFFFLFRCALTSLDTFSVLPGCGPGLFSLLVLVQSWRSGGRHTVGSWCEFNFMERQRRFLWYLPILCFKLLLKLGSFLKGRSITLLYWIHLTCLINNSIPGEQGWAFIYHKQFFGKTQDTKAHRWHYFFRKGQ